MILFLLCSVALMGYDIRAPLNSDLRPAVECSTVAWSAVITEASADQPARYDALSYCYWDPHSCVLSIKPRTPLVGGLSTLA